MVEAITVRNGAVKSEPLVGDRVSVRGAIIVRLLLLAGRAAVLEVVVVVGGQSLVGSMVHGALLMLCAPMGEVLDPFGC